MSCSTAGRQGIAGRISGSSRVRLGGGGISYLVWLVPIALGMGIVGLAAFLWSMRSGQYEDLEGAAERVLLADAADAPLRHNGWKGHLTRKGEGERATDRSRSYKKKKKETIITGFADRPFDWVAALALVSGAAVIIPSLAALAATLLAVAAMLM